MSNNVEFEGDRQTSSQRSGNPFRYDALQSQRSSIMVRILLKLGIIRNEEQARGVLIIFLIFNFLLAGFIFYYFVIV